jgi:hypothetical protein
MQNAKNKTKIENGKNSATIFQNIKQENGRERMECVSPVSV